MVINIKVILRGFAISLLLNIRNFCLPLWAKTSNTNVYVHPRTVLSLVDEHAYAHTGGISKRKDGMECFRRCRKKAPNKLHTRETETHTWPRRGFSNFFLQSLSLDNLKGRCFPEVGVCRPHRLGSHVGELKRILRNQNSPPAIGLGH